MYFTFSDVPHSNKKRKSKRFFFLKKKKVDHLPAGGKTEGLAAGWIIPGVGRGTFSSTVEDVVATCAVCQTALVLGR